MSKEKFSLRVYGVIINSNNEVLISDERRNGYTFTKFPGGGLEYGEGLKECLQRELKEELGFDSVIGELIYVNEFVQKSAFHDNTQLFAFYYLVKADETMSRHFRENYQIPIQQEGEKQRWISIRELDKKMFTFPIDQKVVEVIRSLFH